MALNCPSFRPYSFKNVVVTLADVSSASSAGDQRVIGFWEGDDVVTIKESNEGGTALVGADGYGIMSMSADQTAMVTLKLMPNSPWNKWLRDRWSRGKETGTPPAIRISVRDTSNNEGGNCQNAFIRLAPEIQFGQNATERVYEIFCSCWHDNNIEYTEI